MAESLYATQIKHFCLPRLGRFHAGGTVERTRLPRGKTAFLRRQKENARTQGAFFGSATFIRCRTTHTRTPCAAASKAPTAHGRAPTVYHARCAVPCRIENTAAPSGSRTHENACRLVYLAGGICARARARVPRRSRSRNRERVTALFDSGFAASRV